MSMASPTRSHAAPEQGPGGAEKAAILMLALGEEHAAKLVALLDLEEVREISHSMSLLGPIEAVTVERLLLEFRDSLGDAALAGGAEVTGRLLAKALEPGRAEAIMREIRGPAGHNVWDRLGKLDDAVLAGFLLGEHPQTAALILSRIEPAQAGRVLTRLPEEAALELVTRMLGLEPVPKEIMADLERILEAELMGGLAQAPRQGTDEALAEILDCLDRGTETRLMAGIEQRSAEAAARVKALMFAFEDLAQLAPAAIQALIRAAGNDRLGVALKGAGEALKELFFSNMSERAANILKEEMTAMGPVRLRDVEQAQQFLVATAKELAAAGEIELSAGGEDELVD